MAIIKYLMVEFPVFLFEYLKVMLFNLLFINFINWAAIIIITIIVMKQLAFMIIIIVKVRKVIIININLVYSTNYIINLLVIKNSTLVEGIAKGIIKGIIIVIFMEIKKIITFLSFKLSAANIIIFFNNNH